MGWNRLFLAENILDEWVDRGEATVTDETLHLGDGSLYHLVPAFHFLKESAGEQDSHDLVGRVKEKNSVEELGGEAYMDSVIIGDNAYDVRPGFVGIPRMEDTEKTAAFSLDDIEPPRIPPPTGQPDDEEVITFSKNVMASRQKKPEEDKAAPSSEKKKTKKKSGVDSDELAELLLKHLK